LLPSSNDLLLDSHGFFVWDSTEMEEIDVHQKLLSFEESSQG
jgi:hypothetical protein